MKKNKKSNARSNKRAKKNIVRKTRSVKNMNIRMKKSHDREVSEQLEHSEGFITKVNDFMMVYAKRIDEHGLESLGKDANDIVKLLETMDKDLKDFDEQFTVLKNEAEEFFAETGGNEFVWLPTAIDLVARIDDLRTRYTELYVLNHQTLLTYDH